MNGPDLWKRHRHYLCRVPAIGLTLDVSRMRFEDEFLHCMAPAMQCGLLQINADHQPGVEAGKKAAASILALQGKVLAARSTVPQTAEQIAAAIGAADSAETVFLLLEHLAANGRARPRALTILARQLSPPSY
jgi:hypothetical protein